MRHHWSCEKSIRRYLANVAERQLIRVIDESGEDYLYPADYFVPVKLPQAVEETFSLAA
jgi:hypothetical protein